MEEKKEKYLETYKIIKKTSTVMFVIGVILLINIVVVLYMDDKIHNSLFVVPVIICFFSFMLFLPLQIIYFLCSAIYVRIKFKEVPYINIISIALICIFYMLYYTGFCFKDMRY
jgi:hypothetical protein